MRSASELLRYIDDLIAAAVERPTMYAGSPSALEEVLAAMDRCRDFLLSEPFEKSEFRSSYGKYLSQKGFGVGSYCRQKRSFPDLQDDDVKLFNDLAGFWREYLTDRQPPAGVS